MGRLLSRGRRIFMLFQLLAMMATVAVITGLFLLAVQDVRKASAGAECQSNFGVASGSRTPIRGAQSGPGADMVPPRPTTEPLKTRLTTSDCLSNKERPTPVPGEPILPVWIVARTDGTATASADFTTFDTGANTSIARFNGYATGSSNSASPTDVADPASPTVLASSFTLYALKLTNGITSDVGTFGIARTLTNGAAGSPSALIMDHGSIAADSLVFASEAVVFTTGRNGTITSPITANGDLRTFGPGKLTLNNTVANSVVGINVNSGTLYMTGSTNASGAVSVKNGATLAGAGTITTAGTNGLALGPNATFALGANVGSSYGVMNLSTVSGNMTTATSTTAPTGLNSAGLTFGLGISPTNVVGSVINLNLGAPLTTGAADSGLSNANSLGSLASGFSLTSTGGGTFTLDPITTVLVNGNPVNFTTNSSYSYRVGNVPVGSSGAVTNLGNFAFSNLGSSVTSSLAAR